MKQQKVLVACPGCGHKQPEPPTAYSTVCKHCGRHFRLHDVPRPTLPAAPAPKDGKHVVCFTCGTELWVALTAQSTMCKRCSSHVDLRDYRIANADSKNYKTKGRLVIEENGYLFNTEVIAGDVVLKGRLHGKLTVERSLEIYTGSELKGRLQTAHLVIPAGNRFRWPEPIHLVSADIAGELVAQLQAEDTVWLQSSARLFGDVTARKLIVQSGAVWVGRGKIGGASLADIKPGATA
jgi:cytoskeletal protein CcmA (bactofilin family)/DNA-directed RNA polymerase subunit RPC12/RpoP